MIKLFKESEKREVVFFIISLISLIFSFFNFGDLFINPAWIAILLCGIPIVKGAIIGLVTEFDIKADVLVAIALIASIIIGEIFAAGEIAFIMAIGAFLEERTVKKARAGIERLVQLTPTKARVIRDGKEIIIPSEEVVLEDTLKVIAGETIVVDGIITKGQTSINQSVMTGESLPVDKGEGDEVYSGTVNQFGTFEMVAKKVGEDSSLKRMIRLVESADAGKAKIVGITDKWATWIVAIALITAVGTWFVTGEIIRSVTILVVFCPCALVLATPTAIMAGIGNATKHGILIREGDALERLSKVSYIAFDKTGTLTTGELSVIKVESFSKEFSEDEILKIVSSAELNSEHPLGKAVVYHYKSVSGNNPKSPDTFKMIPGRGVHAEIDNKKIYAGNKELILEQGIKILDNIIKSSEEVKKYGSTVIYISIDKEVIGIIALSDKLRADTPNTVKNIHEVGIKTMVLTGDSTMAASYMAKLAGIEDFKASCLPEDKINIIKEYQEKEELVCMVGDGINDAPSLKTAHVGIAMGGIGSDIAIDAADIVLVGDNIKEIPHLLRLAKKTMGTIKINLTASMVLNFIAIFLAMLGILSPVLGALVHNVGSVAVIINSSLLMKWRKL